MSISSRQQTDYAYFYHQEKAGAHCMMVNGSVQFLPMALDPGTLKALLTVDVGESVNIGDLNSGCYADKRRLNWANCIAVVALLASVVILLVRPRGRGERVTV